MPCDEKCFSFSGFLMCVNHKICEYVFEVNVVSAFKFGRLSCCDRRERLAPLPVSHLPWSPKLRYTDRALQCYKVLTLSTASRGQRWDLQHRRCIFPATLLCLFIECLCAKCHGDNRNWIILEFLMLVKLVSLRQAGLTDIDGPASVTSGRSWREARLGLWLVQSWNTRLWLAPAPFLTWRRRRGIKHASGLATSSVSQGLFRS